MQLWKTLSLLGNLYYYWYVKEPSHATILCFVSELKEEMGLCCRTVFGMEPCQMSFLFFLLYAATAGGVLQLLESTPGSAQELKIKVLSPHLPQTLYCWLNLFYSSGPDWICSLIKLKFPASQHRTSLSNPNKYTAFLCPRSIIDWDHLNSLRCGLVLDFPVFYVLPQHESYRSILLYFWAAASEPSLSVPTVVECAQAEGQKSAAKMRVQSRPKRK